MAIGLEHTQGVVKSAIDPYNLYWDWEQLFAISAPVAWRIIQIDKHADKNTCGADCRPHALFFKSLVAYNVIKSSQQNLTPVDRYTFNHTQKEEKLCTADVLVSFF